MITIRVHRKTKNLDWVSAANRFILSGAEVAQFEILDRGIWTRESPLLNGVKSASLAKAFKSLGYEDEIMVLSKRHHLWAVRL